MFWVSRDPEESLLVVSVCFVFVVWEGGAYLIFSYNYPHYALLVPWGDSESYQDVSLIHTFLDKVGNAGISLKMILKRPHPFHFYNSVRHAFEPKLSARQAGGEAAPS